MEFTTFHVLIRNGIGASHLSTTPVKCIPLFVRLRRATSRHISKWSTSHLSTVGQFHCFALELESIYAIVHSTIARMNLLTIAFVSTFLPKCLAVQATKRSSSFMKWKMRKAARRTPTKWSFVAREMHLFVFKKAVIQSLLKVIRQRRLCFFSSQGLTKKSVNVYLKIEMNEMRKNRTKKVWLRLTFRIFYRFNRLVKELQINGKLIMSYKFFVFGQM